MNQQELEILINHILVKEEEILTSIKTIRVEPDLSAVLSAIERNKDLLSDAFAQKTVANDKLVDKYGEKLQRNLDNQKIISDLVSKNSQLLEYFMDLDLHKKAMKINKLAVWFKRNLAWIAFFSLCVTFCFSIYSMERRQGASPTYRHFTEHSLHLLDRYLDQHPGAIDSMLKSKRPKADF